MGTKNEKKRLTESMGDPSENHEFIENLFHKLQYNNLPEASKKAIKNILATKFREFDILETESVRLLVQNLSQFTKNITFDERYQDCVLEIKNNSKKVNMSNLLTEIRNSNKNNKKKGKKSW